MQSNSHNFTVHTRHNYMYLTRANFEKNITCSLSEMFAFCVEVIELNSLNG